MDGLTLLGHARKAGLTVRFDGDLLEVRGPHSATRIAEALLARKAELAAMACTKCGRLPEVYDEVPWPRLPIDLFWAPGEKWCPLCVAVIVAEYNEHDSWPPLPDDFWVEIEE